MKTPATPWCGPLRLPLAGLALASILVAWPGPVAFAAEPAGEKTFLLFMGADLDLRLGGDAYRVKNVAGDAFVITVDGKPLEVLMNRGKLNLKVNPDLKLSDQTAVVSELKVERAYTTANNPTHKFALADSGAAAQALVGARAGQMASAMMGTQLADERGAALSGGRTAPLQGASAAPQINAFDQANREASSDLNNPGSTMAQLQEELDKKLFDAALVTCELAASRPVQDPYLVVVAYYREKDGNGALKTRIFARALERLDETPVKVRILQGDFPFGYELIRSAIHVYGAGQELGTNVAEKSVALTRDEAHEYLIIDHLTAHKGATLPPTVALGVNDWDLRPHYGEKQAREVVYVRVTKDGRPHGAFHDADCSRYVGDLYLDGLLERVRFKPALQAGKAVDGVAKIKLADLVL